MRVCCSLLGSLLGLVAQSTLAGPLVVNDAGDGGDGTCTTVCTLRDAITNVADGGTITFDPAILPATIPLQKYLAIGKSMRIEGPGAGMLTLSRGAPGAC